MGTTAQVFYMSSTDQADNWGTNVRKMTEADIALNTTSRLNMGNATTVQSRTLDPFNNNGTADGTSQATNYGFALNPSGADGMDSVSTARRIIPAGVWSFDASLGVPAPSGVGGSISAFPTAKVYRVSANGQTRTLLFQQAAAAQATGTLTGAQTFEYDWDSVAQPAYIFEPGETLFISWMGTSTQVVGTLGSAVSVFLTWSLGGGTSFVTLPAPGVRTQFDRSLSETTTTSDALSRQVSYPRALSESLTTTDSFARRLTAARSFSETLVTTDALTRQVTFPRSLSESLTTTDSFARQVVFNRALSETLVTSDAFTRMLMAARSFSETTTTTDSFSRQIIYGRSFAEYPPGVIPDWPVTFPGKHWAGYVRNQDGTLYTGLGAVAYLVRDLDNKVVQTQAVGVDAAFDFVRDLFDPYEYRVIVRETDSTVPDRYGSTAVLPPV